MRYGPIQFLTVSVALVLAGCVHVKIEEDRQAASRLHGDQAIVLVASPKSTGVATEPEFLDCLERKLVGSRIDSEAKEDGKAVAGAMNVVPHAAFVDSVYPWLEPSTVPAGDADFVRSLMARPGVKQRITADKIRYLVAINGQTNVTDKDGSFTCAAGAGGAGCLGLAFWKKESGYEATVWDMQGGNSVGTVGTNVDGRSVFIGAIIPLPFVAPVQSTACAKLAGELRDFIQGNDVTSRESTG